MQVDNLDKTAVKSTVTNLLEFLKQIYSAIDKDEYVTAVYRDFAKAFDNVSKHVLLYKLKRIGVSGKLFDIIQSYLSNRKQFVRVDGTCSTILDVTSGVPQGSILGPLLFCVFIYGLPEHIVHCYVSMFADDIKLLICDSLSSGQLKLNSDLQSLSSCCDNNQMFLTHGKCFYLDFKHTSTSVLIGGQHLAPTENTKDLGLTISADLKWNEHILHKLSQANKVFCMIRKNVSAQLSTHKRMCLYKSMILPIISYASPCFYINKSQVRKIESLQKRVVKWILFYANISYTESLIKLNLLPLNFYLQLNDLLVLARICSGKYETTLSSIFHFTQRRGHWYFKLPASTNEQQRYSFFHRVPALANKVLPRVDIFLPNAKAKLLKLFWTFFNRNFNELLPCTWSICDCINCRLTRKTFSFVFCTREESLQLRWKFIIIIIIKEHDSGRNKRTNSLCGMRFADVFQCEYFHSSCKNFRTLTTILKPIKT